MQKHLGKRIFITGIPTSGKTYLAKRLAKEINGIVISLDDLKLKISELNSEFKKWANFYWKKDEKEYLTSNDSEVLWEDLFKQSEGMWPMFLNEIKKYKNETRPVIFECVNMLPHLAHKDLNFDGIVLIGKSFKETFERNKKDPRWGKTEKLQKLEAKNFFFNERPKYKSEAEKYNYHTFETTDKAFAFSLKLLNK